MICSFYKDSYKKPQDVILDFTFLSGVPSLPFRGFQHPWVKQHTTLSVGFGPAAGHQIKDRRFLLWPPLRQRDVHWASKGSTDETVALWLSVPHSLLPLLIREVPTNLLLAAAEPAESRICPISQLTSKTKMMSSQKLCYKAGQLMACILEVARDSGYVPLQDQN